MVSTSLILSFSAVIFTIGAVGVVVRRNSIVAFMCIELMLNAVNVALVAFSLALGTLTGQIFVFFVMVVAAAEAAVGLAIIIALFRVRESVESTDAASLRG